MIKKNNEKYVAIKTNVLKSFKLQFKILCTEKELTMSAVIEKSIEAWIQTDTPIADFTADSPKREYEIIKGHIPNSLKTQFKVFCTQKGITMNLALYNLLRQWLEANNHTSTASLK